MQIKQAFILAAWYWTRLRPLTLDKPKPLLPIAGKTLLSYHFENLKSNWINKIFINSFYLSNQIDDFVKTYPELNIEVSHEEWEILGTAWWVMKKFDNLDEIFVVVYWDNLTNFNYSKYFEFLSWKEFDVSIMLYKEDNISEKWMVVTDDKWYITTFIEKPKKEQIVSNLANGGIYVIKKEILKEFCPIKWFFDFWHDFFPLLLKNNRKLLSYITDQYLLDIWDINKYNQANEYVYKNPDLFKFQ